MAYDRHMNLVLGDSEEFRKLPPKKGKSEDEVRSMASTRCQCMYVHLAIRAIELHVFLRALCQTSVLLFVIHSGKSGEC